MYVYLTLIVNEVDEDAHKYHLLKLLRIHSMGNLIKK
jgi:hypothetical protein